MNTQMVYEYFRTRAPELSAILDRQGFVALLAHVLHKERLLSLRLDQLENQMVIVEAENMVRPYSSVWKDAEDRVALCSSLLNNYPSLDQVEIYLLEMQLAIVEHVVLESDPSSAEGDLSSPPVGNVS